MRAIAASSMNSVMTIRIALWLLGQQPVDVRDDLVAVEFEIDPVGGRAAFSAAEKLAVEAACLRKIRDGKRRLKARIVRCRQMLAHRFRVRVNSAFPIVSRCGSRSSGTRRSRRRARSGSR